MVDFTPQMSVSGPLDGSHKAKLQQKTHDEDETISGMNDVDLQQAININ